MGYDPKIPDHRSRGGQRGEHTRPPGRGRHGKSTERTTGRSGGGAHRKGCKLLALAILLISVGTMLTGIGFALSMSHVI